MTTSTTPWQKPKISHLSTYVRLWIWNTWCCYTALTPVGPVAMPSPPKLSTLFTKWHTKQ
jgi:hypothetical protein